MSKIAAVQLAHALRVNPSLAYRTPLSRLNEALAALSPAPAIGAAAHTLFEARQLRCGIAGGRAVRL
jgi:hypothetical protein